MSISTDFLLVLAVHNTRQMCVFIGIRSSARKRSKPYMLAVCVLFQLALRVP